MYARLPLGRRGFLKFAAGAAGGLLLAGCGTGRQAQLGGQVNILGWEAYDIPEESKAFLEANNITVNATYITNNDEVLTKYQAGGPGQYDIGNITNRYIQPMIDQNMIQAVDLERVPNFTDTYPVFREATWTRRDGRQYAMPAYFGFDVINYNADLVEKPTTWEVLIDPKYKGRVGMHDSLGTMFFIGVVLGYGGDGATYTQSQLADIIDWGKRWKANSLTILSSYGEMTDLLVRGDIWLAALGWEYVTVQGKKQGANLAHALPDGPAKCWVDSYVLFNGAPNLDNAYGWLNNAFSPEVMALSSQNLSSFVTNPKAIEKMPAEHAEGMNFPAMQEQLDRAVFAFFPPPTVSDPNMITLDELLAGWETIKAA